MFQGWVEAWSITSKALRGFFLSKRYFSTEGPKTLLTHSMNKSYVTQSLLLDLLEFLENSWILWIIYKQGLNLEILTLVNIDKEDETVFHGIVTRHCFLFFCYVGFFQYLLPEKVSLVAVKNFLWQVTGNPQASWTWELNSLLPWYLSLQPHSPVKVFKLSLAYLEWFVFCQRTWHLPYEAVMQCLSFLADNGISHLLCA